VVRGFLVAAVALCLRTPLAAAQNDLSAGVKDFVTVNAPVVALTHVRVIDGTGAPARVDQTVLIREDRIAALGPASEVDVPAGAVTLDLSGKSVLPGLVGMHDHLFYPLAAADRRPGVPPLYGEMAFTFPRLYLAAGVTSLRTTGSIEPYTDLEIKRGIDAGKMPGPKLHLTGPYLEGEGAYTPNMHQLSGPDDARRTVEYWADEGMTSFKAYTHITRAELSAAIAAAHARGLKVTGHLCSIGFHEAIALGIDNLEHGLLVDSEFAADKEPDVCPPWRETAKGLTELDVDGPQLQGLIQDLVRHDVAVTSTLPVFETFVANRPPLENRVLVALAPEARIDYLTRRAQIAEPQNKGFAPLLAKEMEFERAFVAAGGLLLAGEDPTGYGGVLAGFGDQRELELLVEAGFIPLEAIHIATENGARFLGEASQIGTIAVGKRADLVVVDGAPDEDIHAIEKVVTVFKDGLGFDSARLIDSVRGSVGVR
jgi:imidazolonepropionase-like amidohydrolase